MSKSTTEFLYYTVLLGLFLCWGFLFASMVQEMNTLVMAKSKVHWSYSSVQSMGKVALASRQ